MDLRRDDPFLGYGDLADLLTIPVRADGDSAARMDVLIDQLAATGALLPHIADRIDATSGPVGVLLPKVLRVPRGVVAVSIEAPGGASGSVLMSHGDRTPWRLKLRTASFANASALPALLIGAQVDDAVPILQSMHLVMGDVAK
jgi:NADH-quinone oxidoreductase subunit D